MVGYLLQRSRALSSAEMATISPRSKAARGFNGAALFRARRWRFHMLEFVHVMLQRSRALSSAEMAISHAGVRSRDASTEPRSFERGDPPPQLLQQPRTPASTEPRSFERGDDDEGDGEGLQRLASTEPRSFERGDSQAIVQPMPGLSGFNGAALFRARRCRRTSRA